MEVTGGATQDIHQGVNKSSILAGEKEDYMA